MTSYFEVVESFKGSFGDKQLLPNKLIKRWFLDAISSYSLEIEPLNFDNETLQFDRELEGYVIKTLALYMYKFYQERAVSIANKRVSIVGRDLSIDGSGNTKTAEKNHLNYITKELDEYLSKMKPTSYV